jgi:hypothetical protein
VFVVGDRVELTREARELGIRNPGSTMAGTVKRAYKDGVMLVWDGKAAANGALNRHLQLESAKSVENGLVRQRPPAARAANGRSRPHRVGLKLPDVNDVRPRSTSRIEQHSSDAVGERAADSRGENVLVEIERRQVEVE